MINFIDNVSAIFRFFDDIFSKILINWPVFIMVMCLLAVLSFIAFMAHDVGYF